MYVCTYDSVSLNDRTIWYFMILYFLMGNKCNILSIYPCCTPTQEGRINPFQSKHWKSLWKLTYFWEATIFLCLRSQVIKKITDKHFLRVIIKKICFFFGKIMYLHPAINLLYFFFSEFPKNLFLFCVKSLTFGLWYQIRLLNSSTFNRLKKNKSLNVLTHLLNKRSPKKKCYKILNTTPIQAVIFSK